MTNQDDRFMALAIEQAQIGWDEGGIPIGAALVHDGEVLAVGRNRRVQLGSAIRHGETDCLENAGRLPASVYRSQRAVHHPVPLLHVRRDGAALRHPTDRDRREPNLLDVGGLASQPRRRADGARRATLRGADGTDGRRARRAVGRGHRRGARDEHDREGHDGPGVRDEADRPRLPDDAGATGVTEVAALADRGAARLHGVHADDAGRRLARSLVRVRAAAGRDPRGFGAARCVRRGDGLRRLAHPPHDRDDGALLLRQQRIEARLVPAGRDADRLVRRRRRDDRRPHRAGAGLAGLGDRAGRCSSSCRAH